MGVTRLAGLFGLGVLLAAASFRIAFSPNVLPLAAKIIGSATQEKEGAGIPLEATGGVRRGGETSTVANSRKILPQIG